MLDTPVSFDSAASPAAPVPRISEVDFTVALHVLKQAVDATSCGIVITDPHQPDNPIVYHNGTFERLTGYSAADILGNNCRFLQGAESDQASVDVLRDALKNCTDCQVTLLNYKKDGATFWNELYMSPVFEPRTGRLTHFIGVQNDVTARVLAEKERDRLLTEQKRVADTLQEALLTMPASQTFPGFDFDILYKSAWDEALVGGDFSDTFALPNGETAFIVGDVMGKGLAAATFTGQIKFALRVFLRDEACPDRALEKLNHYLITAQHLDNLSQYALVSLSIVVANGQTGVASVATAGAEPPLLLRSARGNEPARVEFAVSEGALIGVAERVSYVATHIYLSCGDTILLFTDGITEAHNLRERRQGRDGDLLFGANRILQAVVPHADAPLPRLTAALYQAALTYAGGRLHDDVCIMGVRFSPPQTV